MSDDQIIKLIKEISVETQTLLREFTEQKTAQENIEKDYKELNDIFNTALDATLVIGNDYSILRANENMTRLTGYSLDKLKNCKCHDVFGSDNCFTSNCPVDLIQRGEDIVEFEADKRLPGGTKITGLITAVPLKNSDGSIAGIVKTIKDITKRKRAEERINFLAHHDHLTGLPNRMSFLDRLFLEIAHSKRNQRLLAVIFIDLDGFKMINDTLGHEAGDSYLVEVSKRLASVARESDTVARIGGDEFTVVLTGLNRQKDALIFAKRLIAAFEEPWSFKGSDYSLTASLGIALYPGDGENPYTLLKKADQAMYRAKKEGTLYRFYNFYLNEQ